MLLGFLLFSLCASTVTSQSFTVPSSTRVKTTPAPTTTTMKPDVPRLEATPDYPVAAGQRVRLYCKTTIPVQNITWSWYSLRNQSWENVDQGNELFLTEPKQSGEYRCETNIKLVSQTHTVYIVFIPTEGEMLGKAAFALSILILIVIVAGLLWFCWQKFGNTDEALKALKKDVTAPPIAQPKVLPPPNDSDGDIYMNYTTPSYSDL